MSRRVVWWLIASVEALLSVLLLALDVSAWAYDWTVGVVVTLVVAFLLGLVWKGMLEIRDGF